MLESKVEKYLIKRVKEYNGHIRKLAYIGRRGATDRLVLFPEIGMFAMAELKKPGKDAEAHQEREHTLLRASGIRVYVLDTLDDVDKFMAIYA